VLHGIPAHKPATNAPLLDEVFWPTLQELRYIGFLPSKSEGIAETILGSE
jgi:hypothetical protein